MGLTMEKLQWAAEILTYVVNHEEGERLKTGKRRRAAIKAMLDAGETPTGYRVEFIEKASVEVIRKLGEIAARFDKNNPDDMCSANDLIDILATASGYIQRKISGQ